MSDKNPLEGDHLLTTRGGELGFGLATLVTWANFIALAAASGVIGNATFQFLAQWRQRHGKSGVEDLHSEILQALKKVKRKPGVSNEDLRRRVDEIIKKHESLWGA